MRKIFRIHTIGLFCLSVIICLFMLAVFVGAQGKVTAKPNKGKPQVICDFNGNCEYEEYDSKKDYEDQPCLDCIPQIYGPLVIGNLQIVGMNSPGQVCQCKYTGNPNSGGFGVTWASEALTEPSSICTGIGDIDNDGLKEIAALCRYTTIFGKGKNETYYYNHELLIYEDNDMEEPSSRLDLIGELTTAIADNIFIADVDDDENNEFLVLKSGTSAGIFEVYDITQNDDETHSLERLYVETCQVYEPGIWNIEVGDVDNDLQNEILLSQFKTIRPTVLEFNGNGWTAVAEEDIDPIGSDEGYFDDGTLNFNIIRVDDVDNDGGNELVAGGNNGRLMIWKYDAGRYVKFFVNSDPIDGATWALDTGDIDGDLTKEIVMGRSRHYDSESNFIVIYEFNGSTYQQVPLGPIEETNPNGIYLNGIGVEDFDGDGLAEIVAGLAGLTIYQYHPGQLERIYNFAYGRSFKIN
jgi:hypothetical protein